MRVFVCGWVCVHASASASICLSVRPSVCVCLSVCLRVTLDGRETRGVGSETNRALFLDEGLRSALLLEIELLQRPGVRGKVERQDVVRVVIIKELGRVRGSIQKGGENGYQGK